MPKLTHAHLRRNPHAVNGLNPMVVFNPKGSCGRIYIPFWKTENGFETDEKEFGLGCNEAFEYFCKIGDFEVTNGVDKFGNKIRGVIAQERFEKYLAKEELFLAEMLDKSLF